MTRQSTWISSTGQHVPVQYVPKRDKLATRLVQRNIKTASALSNKLIELRQAVLDDVDAFIEWSAAENGVKTAGGAKGNVDITTFDGLMQVRIRKPEYIAFDERLQQAKQLIDQFLRSRVRDQKDQALIALVTAAFTTTRDGRVRADAVLSVQRRVRIDDPTWRQAMDLIEQSKQAVTAKTYVRFYVRQNTEEDWFLVPLDIANV